MLADVTRNVTQDGWRGRKGCAGADETFAGEHNDGYLSAIRARVSAARYRQTEHSISEAVAQLKARSEPLSNKTHTGSATLRKAIQSISELAPAVASPEKAGVGGSIPSLATTFYRT